MSVARPGRAAAPFQPDPGGRRDLAYRVADPMRDDEHCLMGQRDLDGLSPHTTQPTASAASPIGTVVQHATAKGSAAQTRPGAAGLSTAR